MKKAISFILALLAAVGKECYQTFVLGLITATMTALACKFSLWTALPVIAAVALILARLVAKVRAVKLSRGEAMAYAVGNLATWLLLAAGCLVK